MSEREAGVSASDLLFDIFYIHTSLFVLSLSLSLSIYIYIYVYILSLSLYICIYIGHEYILGIRDRRQDEGSVGFRI